MKKIILLITVLCFTSVAEAKVVYNNSVMNDNHLNTIKGLLYDSLLSGEQTKKADFETYEKKVSKAVMWLTNCHNNKNVFKLETINTEEAIVVKSAIATITDVIKGAYPGFSPEHAIQYWTDIGSRVHAHNKNNKIWKLELRTKKNKTQNLVFRHAPEVSQR